MFIFKKEKQVVKLVLAHIDKTSECLDAVTGAIKDYVSGNRQEMETHSSRINHLETEADRLLREIRELLYSGAYLPLIRGDIHRLMSTVDDIANKAEDCYEFVSVQTPEIPEQCHAEIVAIIDLTEGCFVEFRKALKAFFKPKGELDALRKHTKKVGELESLIDDNEHTLTTQIFHLELPLSEKLHFQQFITTITRISDVVEDAADELELVSFKSIA